MSERKWVLREGIPYCGTCGGRLAPVDEPAGLRCSKCGKLFALNEDELARLTFDLTD